MDILDSPRAVDPQTVSPYPTIVRYGLISGLILIVYSLVGILGGVSTPKNGLALWGIYSLLSLVIAVLIMVMPVKKHREESGGYILFSRAFLVAFLTSLIAWAVSIVFSFAYTSFIDTEYNVRVQEEMRGLYEAMKMPEEQIDTAIEKAKAQAANTSVGKNLVNLVIFLLVGSALGALVALIVAAIMQKKPKVDTIM